MVFKAIVLLDLCVKHEDDNRGNFFLDFLLKIGHNRRTFCGEVAEWLMAADCKSARVSVR